MNSTSAAASLRKRRRRFSPLLLWRLSKAHAWSGTVLAHELNAGGLDCSNNLFGGLISAAEGPIEGL
jgi:hypothetical protein